MAHRHRVDQVANGVIVPNKKGKTPPGLLKAQLRSGRRRTEQTLANHLHALLSEVFDAAQLPSPDVTRDPDAAVKLAQIAVSGQLPGESQTPSETGFVWLWPAVIVVGMVLYTITTAIRSQADVAKEEERLRCIREGACTDYGFWLKVGSIAFLGWFAWEKLGVGARFRRA